MKLLQSKRIILFFSAFFIVFLFPVPAMADVGPKPSVTVDLKGQNGVACYGTLLSRTSSSGPFQALSEGGYAHYEPGDDNYEIFLKFADYKDVDGYYFLQFMENCTETGKISWGYYPPDEFKILLYFPGEDRFSISDKSYNKYAFHTHYAADVSQAIHAGLPAFSAVPQYPYGQEIAALLVRIFLTIAIELGIALLFGFRERKLLVFIAGVNAVTQILLNIFLAAVNYKEGPLAFVLCYVLLEGIVFLSEAIVYAVGIQKISVNHVSAGKAVGYALTANVISFAVGFCVALFLPAYF